MGKGVGAVSISAQKREELTYSSGSQVCCLGERPGHGPHTLLTKTCMISWDGFLSRSSKVSCLSAGTLSGRQKGQRRSGVIEKKCLST